jgi:hypothetical protein
MLLFRFGPRFGSVSNLHSFDVPSLSFVGASLFVSTGSNSVTAVGANMGSFFQKHATRARQQCLCSCGMEIGLIVTGKQ